MQLVWSWFLFTDADIKNFQQGTHYSLYNYLGNKQITVLETPETYFAVWAPNAMFVSVTGYFNEWNKTTHPLKVRKDISVGRLYSRSFTRLSIQIGKSTRFTPPNNIYS